MATPGFAKSVGEAGAGRADRKALRAAGSQQSGVCQLEGVLEVPEPVASALDVEDMSAVQQPVEDGGGQNLIAGELEAQPCRLASVRHHLC